jgi:serine/threonine protein kinase
MGQFIRNYEVIRDLGSGHFGTVHLAVGEVPSRGARPPVRRLVAIKKLKDSADPEAVSLLLQEFALLDQVKHRGVVRVFEYLEEEHAVVMEYIHGVSLRQVLDELERANEQVFTESAIEIGCELADALYQAFTTPGDNGEPLCLVHRDLKPANVMLTPNGEVKILDFGLARVDNKEFDKDDPERIKGTPIYMAPEQARGEAIDHRTDLFTLGLILYELLMNQAAYRVPMEAADPIAAIFDAIEAGALQSQCAELESRLPALGPVVTRLLQPRPADRFHNGQDVLVDLRRQLYRDRGAYLREFCAFFFGTIKVIGEPPKLEDYSAASARGGRGGRKSIEERLRESMARDTRSRRPPRSEPTPSAGVDSFSGASGSNTPHHRPAASIPPTKKVGGRRPDETGMLEMVSLQTNLDELAAAGDASATQFFAIPAPKAERSRPADLSHSGGAVGPQRSSAPPPPPPGRGGGPPPPSGIGLGAPMGPVVQGPVASAGGVSAGNTPFQTTAPAPTHLATDQRVQSNRVYAIVAGMVMMVCVAVLTLILVVPRGGGDDDPGTTEGAITVDQNPTPKKKFKSDTGTPKAKVPTRPRPPEPRTPASPNPTPAVPAPPTAGRGAVIIRLADVAIASSGQLSCPGGFRARRAFAGGVARWTGVPAGPCSLQFLGGAPARFRGIQPGSQYTCNVIGTTAVCQ